MEALAKARRYCAQQEHCHQEVRDKLYDWGLHREQVEQVIGQLITEDFLDEQRFAEHYAVSKFRQKGWGRIRIREGLKGRKVAAPCIALGLKAIDREEYAAALRKAIAKYLEKEKGTDPFARNMKAKRYFLGRGFETEVIEQAMDRA